MRVHNRQLGVFVPGNANNPQLETPFQNIGVRGLGYFAPACFPVPQIPVVTEEAPSKGMGCACNAGPSYGLVGMGTVASFTNSLTAGDFSGAAMGEDFIEGIPNVLVLGVGAYLIFSFVGDTKRGAARTRSAYRAARAA